MKKAGLAGCSFQEEKVFYQAVKVVYTNSLPNKQNFLPVIYYIFDLNIGNKIISLTSLRGNGVQKCQNSKQHGQQLNHKYINNTLCVISNEVNKHCN